MQYAGQPLLLPRDCPFGVPGDRLFVQEEWCKGEYWTEEGELWYRARPEDEQCFNEGEGSACDSGWHAAGTTMPPYASRTLLDVTDVRVVRAGEVARVDMLACMGRNPGQYIPEARDLIHVRDAFRCLYPDAGQWLWLGSASRGEAKGGVR